MKPIIYAPSALGVRESDQAPSRAAVDALDESKWDIVRWRYLRGEREETMYSRGLAAIWSHPEAIIIIEHDMVPTPAMIDELYSCPRLACVQAYWISPIETGRFVPIQNVGTKDPIRHLMVHREDGQFPEWADWAGPGLAKLAPELRKRWEAFPITSWGDVERSLNTMVKEAGVRWHVHRPVCEHLHGFHRHQKVKVSV